MPTTIKLKNSVTTTNTPTSLVQGEVAINVTDKKVWVGNAATTPIQIVGAGTTGNAAGSNTQVQYNSSGSFAGDADFTFNGTTVTMANDASISGLTVGKGGGAVSTNTVVGASALASNTTGGRNIAIGGLASYTNSTGSSNIFVGYQAGYYNTTSYNIGIGDSALAVNTSGASNTAIGTQALNSNTTANGGTAVGYQALYSNTTGAVNTAVGQSALYANTTGQQNVAVGDGALQLNTTGSFNTSVGRDSLEANTTGANNSAFGWQALLSNTTASNNTAVGYQAGYSNTTGFNNQLFGYQAGYSNTTGAGLTAIGYQAGYSNTTSYNNVYIGNFAGKSTTGTQNTFVGCYNGSNGCGELVTTGAKNTILGGYTGNQGGLDIRTASNRIVISDGDGNPVISWNGADSTFLNSASGQRYVSIQYRIAFVKKSELYWDADAAGGSGAFFVVNASGGVYLTSTGTSWTSNSDERLKENLVPIENGLEKVCSLRSVIGNFIADETKKKTPFLIAQDVEAVLPEAVSRTTLKDDESGTEYLGVSYTETIPLLVAAIKELKAEVDSLKAQLNNGA